MTNASDLPTAPYDALVARHLRTVASARLWVGESLARANWGGIDETFGGLLAAHPGESILAVYDDSAFGRGRAGFVVTDAAIYYVQPDVPNASRGCIALADVTDARAGYYGPCIRVTTGRGRSRVDVELRVDERDAFQSVLGFLSAVAGAHRNGGSARIEGTLLSAQRAIERLETLVQTGKLDARQRERVRALAARMEADPAHRVRAPMRRSGGIDAEDGAA